MDEVLEADVDRGAQLVLVLWAPIAALESPIGVALFAAIIGGAAVTLGRQSMLEVRELLR